MRINQFYKLKMLKVVFVNFAYKLKINLSVQILFLMRRSVQKPLYEIQINTKSFKHKSLPIQQRIRSEYLPRYWRKLNMDQKIIKPNQQDRLSMLTTKQIDCIIDMQKIKYILKGKKNGNQQVYLNKYKCTQNKHPNVYRANFLSKINKIAIQRRIFTQQPEGFQSIYGQYNPQSIRRREIQKQKQNIKYIKVYKSAQQMDKNKFSLQQMKQKNKFFIDDQKSIASISDQNYLELSEQKVKQSQTLKNKFKRNKSFRDDNRLLCSRRWFDGMSTFYLQKKQFFGSLNSSQFRGIDLQSILDKNKSKSNGNKMFNCNRVKTQSLDLSSIRTNNNSNHLITSSLQSLF